MIIQSNVLSNSLLRMHQKRLSEKTCYKFTFNCCSSLPAKGEPKNDITGALQILIPLQ